MYTDKYKAESLISICLEHYMNITMNNSKPLFIALDMIAAWQLMDCRGEVQWGGWGMLWLVAYDQSPPIKPLTCSIT